jgi:glycerol-3-phosphate acyltransferase PlsX
MGGDSGPRVTLPAILSFARQNQNVQLVIVGDETQLAASLSDSQPPLENIQLLHAPDVVEMSDKPATALRNKQQSSMWRAVELVANGEADVCVSAGNTGALMAIGKFLLKTFPGIDRPAICKTVPTAKGHSYMLDLGANIGCSSDQLVQFAIMGSELACALDGLDRPTVSLLNIGAEAIKGNEEVRLAASMLSENPHVNYLGFIEGDGIYRGDADVVVCDGFVGNVALKVSEGVAQLLVGTLSESFKDSQYGRVLGWFARPLLRNWHNKFEPGRYNGASFLGLQGAVIKSHGGTTADGFVSALQAAKEQVDKSIPQRINERLARFFD